MFTTLVQKELKAIMLSPKFAATFGVCSLLLLLSVFIGIQEFRVASDQYNTSVSLVQQNMQTQTSWNGVQDKVYRKPDPMQIFVSGLSYDIGRWSAINDHNSVKLKNSAYSDDPIFAVFRFIDYVFIVQVVFSLFAILFTYDAINGEREGGTLRLILSNAVSRATFILAKSVGAWLGLVLPMCVPLILCLLLLIVFDVPLTTEHWMRVGFLTGLSLLFFSFFIILGVLLSSLSRRSSVSFMTALVLWVAFVLVIPRAGVLAAGQIVSVPALAEIEGQRDGFAKNQWSEYYKGSEKRWEEFNRANNEDGEGGEIDEAAMWARMETEDSARQVVEEVIEEYEARLMEDLRNRRRAQTTLAFTLSRFSPVSQFQLAAMNIATTDLGMKARYEDALTEYRGDFNEYVDRKQKESGVHDGIMITMSSESGFSIGGGGRNEEQLDVSDRPRFSEPHRSVEASLAPAVVDFGLLGFTTLLALILAVVAFLRYDVR